MSRGVCVFDLDNTLGDFRVIDYFGLIYEPKVITGFIPKKEEKEYFKSIIESYSTEEKNFLKELRDTFEHELFESSLDEDILRYDLKEILEPLVEQYKKHKIQGFIIYSNNGNLYALEYAGRAIQRIFNSPNLFIAYLDRYSTLRDTHDGAPEGARTKSVNTIKELVPNVQNKHILFMDDIIHNDFYTNIETTYILVPAYESNIPSERLEDIWDLFIYVFNRFSKEKQELFFNMYHIKTYLKANMLDDLGYGYIQYSKSSKHIKPFYDNLDMIHEKINSYISKLPKSKVGGKRKTKKRGKQGKGMKVKRTSVCSQLSTVLFA